MSSFAVGIFAYTSPFFLKPLGGHVGDGEGESVTFFFTIVTAWPDGADSEAASAVGAIKIATIMRKLKRLITIPLELSHREEDTYGQPHD